MKTKLLILGGCVSLGLAGCASPQGGTDETAEAAPTYSTNFDEGVYPSPMATPPATATNPRDMRDPQAVTIPGPPLGPKP